MAKLIKYLKGSVVPILFVFILLVLQAWCDLSLPAYTSDIVNIGIQQNGIEMIAPVKMLEADANKLFMFMTSDDRDEVLSYYDYSEVRGS